MEAKNTISDAILLTENVLKIKAEITKIEDECNKKKAPYCEQIQQLEENYLDRHLVDSNGNPVKKGMVIENKGCRLKVIDRYQQCLIRYLGNPKVCAIPEGKKKAIDINYRQLSEYTIVEQ